MAMAASCSAPPSTTRRSTSARRSIVSRNMPGNTTCTSQSCEARRAWPSQARSRSILTWPATPRASTITRSCGHTWAPPATCATASGTHGLLDRYGLWGMFAGYERFMQGEPLNNGRYERVGPTSPAALLSASRRPAAPCGRGVCVTPPPAASSCGWTTLIRPGATSCGEYRSRRPRKPRRQQAAGWLLHRRMVGHRVQRRTRHGDPDGGK